MPAACIPRRSTPTNEALNRQLELETGAAQDYHRETGERAGNVLGELADGTGGTYFHGSNDLEGGLHQLMEGPEYLYVLEFSLDGIKHDGAYHTLSVKVNRPGLHLQARHGYFAPPPDKQEIGSDLRPRAPQTRVSRTALKRTPPFISFDSTVDGW